MLSRMKLHNFMIALVAALTWGAVALPAQEQNHVLSTSPSGKWRIENRASDTENLDVWLVSTKDPAQQAQLPLPSAKYNQSWFYFSPDEEWVFATWKNGSFLDGAELFHRKSTGEIEKFGGGPSFYDLTWADAIKLGAVAGNMAENHGTGDQIDFGGWSTDSSRLLVKLLGNFKAQFPPFAYIDLNTRTGRFEQTNYLHKINKAQTPALVCAEPVDPLPAEPELKARFDQLDRELNTTYGKIAAKRKEEGQYSIRDVQRKWVKNRDEGAKIYVSLFPQGERERRRLQYMCDVTAVRIAMPPNEWAFEP
jgi:uncharacterized protein YecT (DUF1311 family)